MDKIMNYKEKRPWGDFENLLETNICKVKKIIVEPNQALSYQYHSKRNEVWTIVQGMGQMRLDDNVFEVKKGEVITIPAGVKHQIKNISNEELIFIEVQLGESFEETDIVRIEDNYGRI